jgi:hypothetical protein
MHTQTNTRRRFLRSASAALTAGLVDRTGFERVLSLTTPATPLSTILSTCRRYREQLYWDRPEESESIIHDSALQLEPALRELGVPIAHEWWAQGEPDDPTGLIPPTEVIEQLHGQIIRPGIPIYYQGHNFLVVSLVVQAGGRDCTWLGRRILLSDEVISVMLVSRELIDPHR